jgi:hypothetical protein
MPDHASDFARAFGAGSADGGSALCNRLPRQLHPGRISMPTYKIHLVETGRGPMVPRPLPRVQGRLDGSGSAFAWAVGPRPALPAGAAPPDLGCRADSYHIPFMSRRIPSPRVGERERGREYSRPSCREREVPT